MAEWKLDTTRDEPGNKACIVFIHGFQGHPEQTWASFPQILADHGDLAGWDVLSFGYETDFAPDLTGAWEGDPEIKTIADSLATFANTGRTQEYGGLVIIAHSMGGLAVQRALLDHGDLTERVDKVVLFGTPSFGLGKAWVFKLPILRGLYRQVRDMGKGSDFIRSLRHDWSTRFEPGPPFGFLAVAGSEDEFVPRTASIDGFPDSQCAVVPGNHIEIVKPADAEDASVSVAIDFIRGSGTPRGEVGTAALALERRDFQRSVNQLGPNRAKLDRRALVDLALALDGLGKRREAMEALADARRHGTDAMGVLAGRHKRNWLRERVDEEARAALSLYGEAYGMAVDKQDAEQAYYHGINLTFLALVYEDDKTKARGLAEEVLGHCAKTRTDERPQDRMWRLATEGEAGLHLGATDTALERYAQALAGPPKPRPWQLTSIAQQALRTADELGDEAAARGLLDLFQGNRS
jgi:pimeloyl-ACP methyl ester carboxylesterase